MCVLCVGVHAYVCLCVCVCVWGGGGGGGGGVHVCMRAYVRVYMNSEIRKKLFVYLHC